MRNYNEEPLKHGEKIPKDELYHYFIEQNMSIHDICKIFNVGKEKVTKDCRFHGIKKTKEQILATRKQTNLNRYGVEYISHSTEKRQKMQEAMQKHFNDKEKRRITVEKRKQTCLKKYDVENPRQSEEIRNKAKQTCLERYGVEYVTSTKEHKTKIKQSVQKKYGVDNVSQLDFVKKKKQQTFNHTFDTEEKLQAYKNRIRQTNMERYGAPTFAQSKYIDWNSIQEKRYNTLKKNNSFVVSNCEKLILKELQSKFNNVKTNYRSECYPFNCDFYVSDLDLYIEYNGHVSHGFHPFSVMNNADLLLFNKWLKRSQEINFKNKKKDAYKLYLHVWFIRDRLKRKIAKRNDLNWMEFFYMEQFYEWFDSI